MSRFIRSPLRLDRRTFFAAGLGVASVSLVTATTDGTGTVSLAAPVPAESREILAVRQYRHILGHPGACTAVEDGLFPILPERMIHLRLTEPNQDWPGDGPITDRGHDRIAGILASYYGVPDERSSYARLLDLRDDSTEPARCQGLMLSTMRPRTRQGTICDAFVHWWLFVSPATPDGSGGPCFTLVYASSGSEPADVGLAGEYLANVFRDIAENTTKWERIAGLGRLDATRFANRQMVNVLRGLH